MIVEYYVVALLGAKWWFRERVLNAATGQNIVVRSFPNKGRQVQRSVLNARKRTVDALKEAGEAD